MPDRGDALASLVQTSLQNAHPLLREWLGAAGLTKALAEEAEGWLARAENGSLAAEYAHHFPVSGAAPDDYRNRFFETPSKERLLTGIRFRNLQLSEPFVDVVWQEAPFRSATALEQALEAVFEVYRVFRPRYVRFSQSEHEPTKPGQWARVSLQNNILAAPLRVIAHGAGVPHLNRVALEPTRVADVYGRYADEYEGLLSSWPELRGIVSPESRETLDEAEQSGLLFAIRVDGEAAGVYALQRSEQDRGNYDVAEILLYPRHRGCGFAAAAHVAACRRLAPGSTGLLSGTIAALNLPSRRTALRAGRKILKGNYRYVSEAKLTTEHDQRPSPETLPPPATP